MESFDIWIGSYNDPKGTVEWCVAGLSAKCREMAQAGRQDDVRRILDELQQEVDYLRNVHLNINLYGTQDGFTPGLLFR